MENCVVRYARAEDYAQAEAILQQVHTMNMGLNPGWYKPCETIMPPDRFQDQVNKRLFLVAEMKGRVVGILNFEFRHISSPTEYSQHIVHIHAMAVDQKFRRRHVARMLLDRLKEITKNNLYIGIQIEVDARNVYAYDVFLHFGFMERSVMLELM